MRLLRQLRRALAWLFVPRSPDEMALDSPSVIGGACDSPDEVVLPGSGRHVSAAPARRARRADRRRGR